VKQKNSPRLQVGSASGAAAALWTWNAPRRRRFFYIRTAEPSLAYHLGSIRGPAKSNLKYKLKRTQQQGCSTRRVRGGRTGSAASWDALEFSAEGTGRAPSPKFLEEVSEDGGSGRARERVNIAEHGRYRGTGRRSTARYIGGFREGSGAMRG